MISLFSTQLIDRLLAARSVAVLTGAGISAESGIPTFRDPGGLWQQFKPEELANVRAFLNNPSLVQQWYSHRRSVAREKEPNPGHWALVELERFVPEFTLITQNVDNLHQRAGSRNVVELHGNITRSNCIRCGLPAGDPVLDSAVDGVPIQCPACGGLIRPDVVWFGEMLPEEAVHRAYEATKKADVFLSIGTSAIVYPAAGIPLMARDYGAYTAEINMERSAIASQLDEVIQGKSGEVLPLLMKALVEARENVI